MQCFFTLFRFSSELRKPLIFSAGAARFSAPNVRQTIPNGGSGKPFPTINSAFNQIPPVLVSLICKMSKINGKYYLSNKICWRELMNRVRCKLRSRTVNAGNYSEVSRSQGSFPNIFSVKYATLMNTKSAQSAVHWIFVHCKSYRVDGRENVMNASFLYSIYRCTRFDNAFLPFGLDAAERAS